MASADETALVRIRVSPQIVRTAGRRWARPAIEAAAQRPRIAFYTGY